MKKLLSIVLLLGLVGMLAVPALAADPIVYVTIADENGKLAVAQQAVNVTDADGDGALTVNDALIAAHNDFYDGGAAAGYASTSGEWGLSMDKLWGTENGGSYGYYVNGAAAWSLADPVSDGDYVDAFVYTDLVAWSDTYCSFETRYYADSNVTVTLIGAGYDENWNLVSVPVAGAELTLNGTPSGVFTDENGQATLTLGSGKTVISATSTTQTLVPPVAVAETAATAPQTGALTAWILAAVLTFGTAVRFTGRKNDEK